MLLRIIFIIDSSADYFLYFACKEDNTIPTVYTETPFGVQLGHGMAFLLRKLLKTMIFIIKMVAFSFSEDQLICAALQSTHIQMYSLRNHLLPQGCHLYRTQPGTTEESPVASEAECVRTLRYFFFINM